MARAVIALFTTPYSAFGRNNLLKGALECLCTLFIVNAKLMSGLSEPLKLSLFIVFCRLFSASDFCHAASRLSAYL
jgi:hypothetical protein